MFPTAVKDHLLDLSIDLFLHFKSINRFFGGVISFKAQDLVCVFTFFVCASPCCWFLAAVLHRTLCVWHKLSRTVPVKYKKLHTHIGEVSHKNRTHFTYNIHKKYRKNTPLRIFTKNFVCVCTN